MDRFNPFIIELSITTPTREVTPGDGNQMAEDLTQFPVVITNPPSPILVPLHIFNWKLYYTSSYLLQMDTFKACGGEENSICIPDLRIDISDTVVLYVRSWKFKLIYCRWCMDSYSHTSDTRIYIYTIADKGLRLKVVFLCYERHLIYLCLCKLASM